MERSAVLLHLVDGTSETMVKDYKTILNELVQYGGELADKPRVTVLNKIDTMDAETRKKKMAALKRAGAKDLMAMSGVSKEGVIEVLRALRTKITTRNKVEAAALQDVQTWHP